MLDGYYDVDFAPGTTYQVELAPNEDEYLLWDKTFDEQSEKVKAALIGDGYTPPPKPSGDHKNPWGKLLNNLLSKPETGEDIYNRYVYREADQYGNYQEKQASEHLLSLGIRGIKYLDGTSRNADDGSYNYVIFDESDIEIQVKYSKDGKIQGFYLNGKAYLVEDGIAEGDAMGVLMHEFGEHAAQLGFKNNLEYRLILKSLEKRQNEQSATGEAIRAAMQRVPKGTAAEHQWSEVAAYLVENNADQGLSIVNRLVAFFKKWLFKAGGISADAFTHKDLTAFAYSAVRAEARRSGKLAEGGRVADVALSRQQQAEASESRAAKTNGLPMDFDSRMARAREMGFDTDTVFSHASWTDPVIERILAKDTTFDGLFAVEGEESSHGGPHQHRFIVKTHFDHADLSRSFRNDDAPFKEVVKRELGEEPGTNEDWSLLEDLVLENESVHELWSDEDSVPTFFKEALGGYISGDLLADISWNIQKLRGKVAKEYGADAIDMTDEHGTSVLLLPGSGVRSLKAAFDPSYVESDQLLRSMAESLGVTPEQLQREYDAVVERYKGTAQWLKAPNGKPSNLNERQWVLVRTPRFKEWFGGDWETENGYTEREKPGAGQKDSEISRQSSRTDAGTTGDAGRAWRLDRDTGEPRVFYHGTKDDITTFDLDHPNRKDQGWLGRGVYVSGSTEIANTYALNKRGDGAANVMPVFAAVKNPKVISFEQKQRLRFASQKSIDEFTEWLKERGYDGVVMEEPNGAVELAAFSPTQIKSAAGNTGAFDSNNTDIRYSVAKDKATDEKHTAGYADDFGSIADDLGKKHDIWALTSMVKTAEYTLSKVGAGMRMLDAAARRMENRFRFENEILDNLAADADPAEYQEKHNSFINTFRDLKKDSKDSYQKVQGYLLEADRTGEGFRLKHEYGYAVYDPDGNFLGIAKTKEKAHTLVQRCSSYDLI